MQHTASLQRATRERWHRERARAILEAHPEVRALVGTDPRTYWLALALVTLQLGLAAVAERLGWPVALLGGWTLGGVIAHALGVCVHEFAHELGSRRHWLNRTFALVANLPLPFPAAIDFRAKHLAHHAHLGLRSDGDTQEPTATEARFTGDSAWRRLLWLTFGPLLFHATEDKEHAQMPAKERKWFVLNVLASVAVAILGLLYARIALVYLVGSGLAAFGPHAVGIRRYAEHVTLRDDQPTNSYYGAWNWFALGVGHHVEHHDFPGIPWTRLAQLRALAPEFYEPLARVRSWNSLLASFVFDPAHGVARYGGRRLGAADHAADRYGDAHHSR